MATLPPLSPEERKAEIERYIAEWNATWNEATPEEREIATLERQDRLSADQLARLRDLYNQTSRAA